MWDISESVAMVAINDHNPSKYRPKTRRNDLVDYENDLRKSLNQSEVLDINTESIEMRLEPTLGNDQFIFDIPYDKVEIMDMYVKIYPNNPDYDFYDILDNCTINNFIEIKTGGSIILSMSLQQIILLAKYLSLDVSYEDNSINIPIPFKQFFFSKNFPLYKMEHMHLQISIKMNDISHTQLIYNTKKPKSIKMYEFYVNNIIHLHIQESCTKKFTLHARLIGKVILFKISSLEIISPVIDEIKLYLNNFNPIVYDRQRDEILEYYVYGTKYYGISLCENLLCKKDIKKIFRENEKCVNGINFSRIDDVEIEICGSEDLNVCRFEIVTILVNRLHFASGMVGLKYGF
ncbi:hypothetical protein [Acanthamoeba polyphaga mimivirus]|uniref:Uncharacterized protein n=1 Tax=Acanthamoeba polyphaga mimivirus TaxID=212035 RepID=A0A2L2DIE3_MIMIV|nr:hypothetical protein [Acanthamoeba polyphaga mimivirus]AVL93554.1 hypothetical protein mvi_194 [Megavirus vitis]